MTGSSFERPQGSATPVPFNRALIVIFVVVWFVLSTFLTLFNKYFLGKKYGIFDGPFPAPMLGAAIQFSVQFAIAYFLAHRTSKPTKTDVLSFKDYMIFVVLNGVSTGLDIGFSNKALHDITSSLYTMVKASSPMFLLFFAFIFKVERLNWQLAGIILLISFGLFLLVADGTGVKVSRGFWYVLAASALSGLRWTTTQVLLQGRSKTSALGGPIETMAALTPFMVLTTFLLSLCYKEFIKLSGSVYFSSFGHSTASILVNAISGVIAFLMIWSEYNVIQSTSALTMNIIATLKEIITVLMSVIIYHDKFTWQNSLGLLVIILGASLYSSYRRQSAKATQRQIELGELNASEFGNDLDASVAGVADEVQTCTTFSSSPKSQLAPQQDSMSDRDGGERNKLFNPNSSPSALGPGRTTMFKSQTKYV